MVAPRWRLFVIGFAVVCLALAFAIPAHAVGTATFFSHIPAKGSVSKNVRPTLLRANASDTSPVFMDARTFLTLDGAPVSTIRSNPGYWYWDEEAEEDYWISDPNQVLMQYTIPATLTEGVHTAIATVASANGVSTDTWSFTYATPPVVTGVTPAPNSGVRDSSVPTLSVTLNDSQTSPIATLTIDGASCTPTWDAATRTFTYKPATALADGLHTATISFADLSGWSDTYSWGFSTGAAVFTAQSPTPISTIKNQVAVTISTRVDDVAPLSGASVLLDGRALPTSFQTDGYLEWDPEEGYEYWVTTDPTAGTVSATVAGLTDGLHTVTVNTSGQGGAATTSWSFYYGTPPKVVSRTPASGEVFYSTATPLIQAVMDDAATSADATLTVDGVKLPVVWNAATKTFSATPASALADGWHTVSLTARDAQGWEDTTTWSFRISMQGEVSWSSAWPSANTTITTASTSLGISGQSVLDFRDPLLPSDCALAVDGVQVATIGSLPDSGYDDWGEWYFNKAFIQLSGASGRLADGRHTVTARVVDSADRPATTSWTFGVAEPPSIGQNAPATGTTTGTPEISVVVADNSPLDALSATMTVDGVVVPAVFDRASGKLVYRPTTPLSNAALHSVKVDVQDGVGAKKSLTWSFLVQNVTVINMQSPTPTGTVYSSRPYLSAIASGSVEIQRSSAKLKVDGVAQTTFTNLSGSVNRIQMYGYPSANLADGVRTAEASVSDIVGTTKSYSWTFTVKVAPTIQPKLPVAGDVAPSLTPTISCDISDNTPMSVSVQAWVDGSLVASETAPQGAWNKKLTTALAEGVNHTALVKAVDAFGNSAQTSWTFQVAKSARMPMDACTDCHRTYPAQHTYIPCENCHHSNFSDCFECHDPYGGPHGSSFEVCESCHTGAHQQTSVEAVHVSKSFSADCAECHVTTLHREHARTSSSTGKAIRCVSCHGSPSQLPASMAASITAAFSSGNTSCVACHAVARESAGAHRSLHALSAAPTGTLAMFGGSHLSATTTSVQVNCIMCHKASNLLDVHGNNCAYCHPGPRESFTSWSGGCQQGTCHPTYHDGIASGHARVVDPEHLSTCAGCHDASTWAFGTDGCGTCHTLNDETAPTTSANTLASYVGPASIKFAVTDKPAPGGSGVASTFYQLDAGSVTTGTAVTVAQPASGSATHTIRYRSVDGAGNAEATQTASFTVTADTTAPSTSCGASGTYWGATSVAISTTDNGTTEPTTYYRLDGGSVTTGKQVAVAEPASGVVSHSLEYWAVDAAGNASAHKTAAFSVARDTTAPVTTSNIRPFYQAMSPSGTEMLLTPTDGGSGVATTYFSYDGAPVEKGTRLVAGTWMSEGPHTLKFWSVDKSGNVELATTAAFTVDRTSPVTTSNAQASYDGSATVSFTAADNSGGAGVSATYWQLDLGAAQSGGVAVIREPGAHVLTYWSVDAVGNAETKKSSAFTVSVNDTVAPVTTSDAATTYESQATIKFTATDAVSGVKATYYRLDGAAAVVGTTLSVATPGAHTLEFWSVDNAGNVEIHRSTSFTVNAPTGKGTITFAWDAPDGAWADYYVYDSTGRLVAQDSNESGWYTVNVPVSSKPYTLKAYWFDPYDPGYPVWSYGTALVDANNKSVVWYY